jgi:microcystin-dependent protein
MADAFIGEIKMFAGNYAPENYSLCDGQLVPISQNPDLYSLFGNTYGGDGVTTFGLPDLRGRIPVHQGQGPGLSAYTLGEKIGVENVTLTTAHIPAHVHAVTASETAANAATLGGNVLARGVNDDDKFYVDAPGASFGALVNGMVGSSGGSQPHTNMMPGLCVNFIVCLSQGTFPTRS